LQSSLIDKATLVIVIGLAALEAYREVAGYMASKKKA
jgi:hypothetical protein